MSLAALPGLPPPAEAPSPPLDLTMPDWAARLAEQAASLPAETLVNGVDLVLLPETLGTLHLRVELRDGAVQVMLNAENPEAARLLAAGEARLAEAFARAGLAFGGQGNSGTGHGPGGHANPDPRRAAQPDRPVAPRARPAKGPDGGRVNLLA